MAKLNLTKLLPEAVKLVGKPKSSLASPPKQKRKQNSQAKTNHVA